MRWARSSARVSATQRRRRRLAAALEHGGYEPHLEATGTIRLRNCPFDALVDLHRPLMCGTNLALAEGIVEGARVTELRAILDPQPGFCCVAFVPVGDASAAGA